MKIIHVITCLDNGGAEGVLVRLAIADQVNSHEVVSLLGDGALGQTLRDAGVPVHSLNIRSPLGLARSLALLVRIIWRAKPDVVQCWMYHANIFGGVASFLAGTKNIAWNLRTIPNQWLSARSRIIINGGAWLSRFLPKAIVCAGAEVGAAHSARGYDSRKLVTIGNGIDTVRFQPDKTKGLALRQELGICGQEWLVGRVARDVAQKDHQTLFEALAALDRCGTPVRCLLIGHGMDANNTILRRLATEIGVDHLLIYGGHRFDVDAVFNAIDLFVSSSRVEGFPNAIAEAMACGIPVAATSAGASAAIVGDIGYVVPIENGQSLANAIADARGLASALPRSWAAKGVASRRRIESEYSMQGMLSSYSSLWQAIADVKHPKAMEMSLEPAS